MSKSFKRKAVLKLRKIKKKFFSLDKPLLTIIFIWFLYGFTVFLSASLGLIVKNEALLSSVLTKQVISIFLAILVMFSVASVKFKYWLALSPRIYILAILFTLMTFLPGISFSAGGASRWVVLGGISLQPAEILKVSTVLFSIYILYTFKKYIKSKYGLLLFFGPLAVPSLILLAQPDTSTLFIMSMGVFAAYFLFNSPYKHIFGSLAIGLALLAMLAFVRPYIKDRIMVFLNPSKDVLGSSYQLNQSKIAIGSGGVFGKGFGQGAQKFGYLPEPVGDSIFAVLSEEFGFMGVSFILLLLLAFVLRCFVLATRNSLKVASVTILAFSFMLFSQAFVNMASMSGLLPLTGLTFPLLSLGGTSMIASGFALGIIFSASKYS